MAVNDWAEKNDEKFIEFSRCAEAAGLLIEQMENGDNRDNARIYLAHVMSTMDRLYAEGLKLSASEGEKARVPSVVLSWGAKALDDYFAQFIPKPLSH